MNRDKQIEEIRQIEEMARVVRKLAFVLRTNMTSITRYVKHERSKSPMLTEGQFIDRHLKYKELANEAVDNILKCINDNEELRKIESMRFQDKGYRKASDLEAEIEDLKAIAEQYQKQFEDARADVAREIFEEIEDVLNNIGYFDELDFNALKKKYTEVKDV